MYKTFRRISLIFNSRANLYKGMYARTFMEISGIDIKKVKKKGPEEMKSVRMQIRTTPKISKWMKDNHVSPRLVFEKVVEGLMEEVRE